ncbi:Gfo/Idh/MocA family protein [Natrinema gelatinilyticum]|uniref:Gfo/Idh/MocA family protein n=1 Tax=Natrinema gelatinilyticum TaxID=2961571 RepID=UPI0020C380C8|nr:Gfo/Idh/MocA family oxidoreductase [Natrinema gelatinilyticum]
MAGYRAGIIGTGGVAGLGTIGVHDRNGSRATASHAGGYDATDGVELVAAVDVNEETLAAFCDAWDVAPDRRYADHEAMLAAEDLDIVSVCTPALFHREHVVDVAEAGVDAILCEKPIASSLDEAAKMIEVCEETDTDLVVNHTLRFTEKFQHLRDLIRSGEALGDVRSVVVQSRMELGRNATHVLDLFVFLFEDEIDDVWGHVTGENESVENLSAANDVDDAAGRAMLSIGDVQATVDCTTPRRASSISYQFLGSAGKLHINLDDGEWRYWRLEGDEHVPADMPGIDGAWTWDDDYEKGFANAVAHARDRLDGSDRTVSTALNAKRSLEALVAIFISHYTGSRVSLPLQRPFEDVEIRSW